MAGICEAGVAAVPLVSVPVSPSAVSAEIAPPVLALSEVVKYGLPRFLGMTNTFRPVFSPLAEVPPAGERALGLEELPDDPQAASTDDTATTAAVSHSDLFMEPDIRESFQLGACQNGEVVSRGGPLADRTPGRPSPERGREPAEDRGGIRYEDAGEQQCADHDAESLLVEARQQQRVLQSGEGEHGQHDADDRALAAEDGNPGEQYDGHDLQFQAQAIVLHGCAEAEG